jgi:hypothetical protein
MGCNLFSFQSKLDLRTFIQFIPGATGSFLSPSISHLLLELSLHAARHVHPPSRTCSFNLAIVSSPVPGLLPVQFSLCPTSAVNFELLALEGRF